MGALTKQIAEDIDGLPIEKQREILDFVRFLKGRTPPIGSSDGSKEPNGTKLARLMREGAGQGLFAGIDDPAAWQREVRQDRHLPGRDD